MTKYTKRLIAWSMYTLLFVMAEVATVLAILGVSHTAGGVAVGITIVAACFAFVPGMILIED